MMPRGNFSSKTNRAPENYQLPNPNLLWYSLDIFTELRDQLLSLSFNWRVIFDEEMPPESGNRGRGLESPPVWSSPSSVAGIRSLSLRWLRPNVDWLSLYGRHLVFPHLSARAEDADKRHQDNYDETQPLKLKWANLSYYWASWPNVKANVRKKCTLYDFPFVVDRASVTDLKDDRGVLRAEVGQELSLSCDCRMSNTREASLYSIKWYRDDREFFRYIPTGETEEMHTSKGFRRSWQILYYLL